MADDLPANLDDGELWLPSDVIRAVGVRHLDHHQRREAAHLASYSVDLAALSSLTENLAALGLMDLHCEIPAVKPTIDYSPSLEFIGQGRPVSWVSPARNGFRVPVSRGIAFDGNVTGGTGAFFPVASTFHTFQPVRLAAEQSVEFGLERSRVLQRQRQRQRQQQQQCQRLNRLIPTYTSGSVRASGGTGVFLPRVANADTKKKPLSVKGSGQLQQTIWNPMIKKQTPTFLPSSEMGLPQDWTY